MSASEKVHYIGKAPETIEHEEKPVQTEPLTSDASDTTRRDMSKVALFVSILSVVLLVVFFFGLNQNLKGVSAIVDQLAVSNGELNGRVAGIEEKVVALENLPHKSKMMVMGTMLQEMAQRAGYLGAQMETPEQNEKLRQAMELLQQVQSEIVVE